MNSGAKGAENFLNIKIGQIFFPKCMANDDVSEPPRRADSKTPIFIFCQFLGLGHLRGPGVSLGRNFGVPSIEPFLGEGGGSSQGALSTPPPPGSESLPASSKVEISFHRAGVQIPDTVRAVQECSTATPFPVGKHSRTQCNWRSDGVLVLRRGRADA